jgi:hypothetical protein
MYNKPIIIECKHCKLVETVPSNAFDSIGSSSSWYKSNYFFVVPTNIQCKKCFGVVDVYVKDDTE